MVIYHGDLSRAFFRPAEDNPPLVVDPDGVKTDQFSLKRFEAVARRHGKIVERSGPV